MRDRLNQKDALSPSHRMALTHPKENPEASKLFLSFPLQEDSLQTQDRNLFAQLSLRHLEIQVRRRIVEPSREILTALQEHRLRSK